MGCISALSFQCQHLEIIQRGTLERKDMIGFLGHLCFVACLFSMFLSKFWFKWEEWPLCAFSSPTNGIGLPCLLCPHFEFAELSRVIGPPEFCAYGAT